MQRIRKVCFVIGALFVSLQTYAQVSETEVTKAGTYSGDEGDFNTPGLMGRSFLGTLGKSPIVLNAPLQTDWWSMINIRHRNGGGDGNIWGAQIAIGMSAFTDRMFFRSQYNGSWSSWRETFTPATPRVLINNSADDGITALQVNGTVKTNNAVVIAKEGASTISNQLYFMNPTGSRAFNMQLTEGGFPGLSMWRFDGSWYEAMRIGSNGNVAIGTTDPKGHKLAVAGSIIAEKIKVKTYANWPDFVFNADYKLPSLQQLEAFIIANKHLPEIPSANDIAENGHDLGEMNKKLLQKVEELTLYVIDLQKQLDVLKKQ
jgi:hypothetical protein